MIGIFFCVTSGFAKDCLSFSLRPASYAEGRRVGSERPKPNEEALIQYATPNWDTQLKVSGEVNPNSLPHMFNAEMTAQDRGNLAAAIKEKFKGDVYLVADEMLAGRRFWYSQDTGTLYFTRSAIAQIGAGNIAGLLTNIQAAIDNGYTGYIETIAVPRQVKPLRVAKRKPVKPVEEMPEGMPVLAAASGPAATSGRPAEPETASGQPVESPEPAALAKPRTIAAKRAMEEVKSTLQALNKQAQKGATLRNSCRITQDTETRDVFTVWFDASDLRPGFTVMPSGSYKEVKHVPVVPHPRAFAANSPVQKTRRYQASLSRDEITELLEKGNRPAARLARRLRQNETEIATKNTGKQQGEWAAETIGLMQTMLEPCATRIESARRQHPGETGAILGYFSESYKNYFAFGNTLYNSKRKIEHSLQHNNAPVELVSEEFDKIIAAAAPWPRLQAILRDTKAGLTRVDLENWKMSSQYFSWNMAEGARTNSLLFMPQDIPREILAEIYYDACRFVFLERLGLLRQQLQAADSADALTNVIVETHRLAALAYSIEWDAAFTGVVKEKANAYTSPETLEASPAYFIGIMLLDAENHPVEIVSGAGSVTPLEDLSAYQDYAGIAQWYRPGHKIVLFAPTLTRFVNFEQFTGYVEGWYLLQRMLPGAPEIWIGSVSEEGKVAVYRPVAPNDQDLWDEIMTLVMQGMPSNQDLAAYLEKEVYDPPGALDEMEVAKQRKIARSSAKMALRTENIHPIYKVARNLPLFIQQGLARSYTPELAHDIMQFLNLYFKNRFSNLREAKGVSIPILHRGICITTLRCQRFAMEYVTRAFILDQEWFQEVAIEDLTDPIGQAAREEAPGGTAQPADLEPKIEFAVRDLLRDAGKYPDIFPPQELTAVEAFAGEWARQRLTAGQKARYKDFKTAWDQAQAKAKSETARAHTQAVLEAWQISSDISCLMEIVGVDDGEAVHNYANKAAEVIQKLDPAADADLICELQGASATLSQKFDDLSAKSAETDRIRHLPEERQAAHRLLNDPGFAGELKDPANRLIFEFLTALYEGRPFSKAAKVANRAKTLSGGNEGASFKEVSQLAQQHCDAVKAAEAALSSVLRPMAAGEAGGAQVSKVDLGNHSQVLITAPKAEGATIEEQTRSILRLIDAGLNAAGLNYTRVVKQTVYVRNAEDAEIIRGFLAAFYGGYLPATDFIQQPPLNGDMLSIQLLAIGGKDVEVKRRNEYLTTVRTGAIKWAHLGGVVPDPALSDTYEQARDCFLKMRALLESEGFNYENVLRTWLYERDIYGKDPDEQERYNKLNRARKDLYKPGEGAQPIRFGNGFVLIDLDGNVITTPMIVPPASTGIGLSAGAFVTGAVALLPTGGAYIQFLENPQQVSAFAYQPGVQHGLVGDTAPLFSRGIAVVFDQYKVIFVSGTASIIGPKTIHIGDVRNQTIQTLDNINLVFNQAGASLKNAAQLTVYVKNPQDYETVKEEVERRCPGIPCVYVQADVCREDLLVEIEAVGFMQNVQRPILSAVDLSSVKIIDIDEIGEEGLDIDNAIAQIRMMNERIEGEFQQYNLIVCATIRTSYHIYANEEEYLDANPRLRTFLMMAGNRIAGYATYFNNDEISEIGYLAVDPDVQGLGIGTELLKKVFKFARSKKKDTVAVDTELDNEWAQKFYDTRGGGLSWYHRKERAGWSSSRMTFTFYLTPWAALKARVSDFYIKHILKIDLRAGGAIASSVLRPRAFGNRPVVEGDWIICSDGARIHRTAIIENGCVIKGPRTVIGAGAVITKGSVIENAIIKEWAYVEASVLRAIEDTDRWQYKPRSDLLVESNRPVEIGRRSRIIRSVVYNSIAGSDTRLIDSTAEHSYIGDKNYFRKAKLSLARTKHDVFATWAELSEGIFGFGFHYDGLALGGPSYFEGVYSNRFPVAYIPGVDLSELTNKEVAELTGNPGKLAAFLKRVRFKSIRAVPHVSIYRPYNIYSVFTGKNLPPENGIIERIEGIPGEQKSQHARNAAAPLVAVAPDTDVAPRIRGRPDPRRPGELLKNLEYTHQAAFSVSGFGGAMVHGQIRPGAESHSLSPSETNHLWTFSHCPGLVFELMSRVAANLPEGQKDRCDDLPVRAIETAFLMTLQDLREAQADLRKLQQKKRKTPEDEKKISSLVKLEANLKKGVGAYIANLRADKKYGIWHCQNGKPAAGWRCRRGLWSHNKVDLRWLSAGLPDGYGQYRWQEILSTKNLKPRKPPKRILSEEDLAFISGKTRLRTKPEAEISKTARIGENVRFYGSGRVFIGDNVKLENIVIISDGDVFIDESTDLSLGRIQAAAGRTVRIGGKAKLNYFNILNSSAGKGTKGYYIRLKDSSIGEANELNPFADIECVKTQAECIIGHVMRHSDVARGFISRHIPTEIYHLIAPPVVIEIDGGRYYFANPMNIGAGAHIMGRRGRPVYIHDGAFIGSNARINPDCTICASFVLGEVPGGKTLLPFTFYNSNTGVEELAGLLDEKYAGVLFRTFIYRGKLYTLPEHRWIGDYLVPTRAADLKNQVVAELSRQERGAVPAYPVSQLQHALYLIDLSESRWAMRNHGFVNGPWKYIRSRDSWKWRGRAASSGPASSVLRPLATGEGEFRVPPHSVADEGRAQPAAEKTAPETWIERFAPALKDKLIAGFSMECCMHPLSPRACDANFAGGLGIYFYDWVNGCRKIGLNVMGFSPLYAKGRVQKIKNGRQVIEEAEIDYSNEPLELVMEFDTWGWDKKNTNMDKLYHVKVFKVKGQPYYTFYCPEIYDILYTDNRNDRFLQETMLGRCVKEFFARLKDGLPQAYHLNEGHVANVLVAMDEIDNLGQRGKIYINHSPVREANEQFIISDLDGGVPDRIRYQGIPHSQRWMDFWNQFTTPDGRIDMSLGAQHLSDETVGVSGEHAGIVQGLFPEYQKRVIPVLNGSGDDWVMPETLEWRKRGVMPPVETRRAIHKKGKEEARRLIKERTKELENAQGRKINENGIDLKMDEPTVWLARRIAKYKSMYPVLRKIIHILCADRNEVFDTPRGKRHGLAMQVVVGGNAPSRTTAQWVQAVIKWMERPELKGRFVFVPGAGRELLKAKAKGGDICVNTPLQGKEACGTSDQRTNLNFDSITVSVDTGGPHDYIQDGENGLLIGPYASDEEFLRNAPWDLLDKLTIASEMYYARQESADTRWDEMAERAHRVANEVVTDEAMAKRYVNAVYLPVLREKGIIAMEDDVKRAASLEEAALVAI